jgi:DNA-binding beta-propeller fold protein YncE
MAWSHASVAAAATSGSVALTVCVAEPNSEPCSAPGFGLTGAAAVAASPDGKNVYVAARSGNAVAVFDRQPGGGVTFRSCFTAVGGGGDSQCTQIYGLSSPSAIAVSPDGKNVYALGSDELETFTRNADGSLTPLACITDSVTRPGCTSVAPGYTLSTSPLNGAVLVSPDGSHLYTATGDLGGPHGAVDVFARAANGALTALGCVDSSESPDVVAPCGSHAAGLVGPGTLTLSPAGYLFAGSYGSIVSFAIQPGGTLSPLGCIGTRSGCVQAPIATVDHDAHSLALTPDGTRLYAADGNDAIDEFRVSGGTLTSLGCVKAPPSAASCASTSALPLSPVTVAVSSDGADLYVGGGADLATFTVGAGGALTP